MHKYLMSARTGVNDRRLARNVFYYESREIRINPCTCIREADANNSLRLMMKLAISVMTAISLSLTSTALADHYNDLVFQGYRWVTADGPYICHAEEDVRQLVAHRTDATELHAVENVHCHYLIPGTVVQVIKEDPAKGMSQIWVGGITTPLWTYTRFLSKHPVRDTYGNIEMPEESGLTPKAQMQLAPLPSDNSAARTRTNRNP
jgi:hypothetical protein